MFKDIISLKKYSKKIDSIKSHLREGNVYQINFTSKKELKSSFKHSFDLYNCLRAKVKPKEGFFVHTNKFDILSFSPELFIKIDDGAIQTSPIKGTRPRSRKSKQDLALKEELINSEKDKAEHLMIVDLLRNDLGKICKTGSIKVQDLYNIQSFETIHHMVTKIFGEIKDGISEVDIIKAMFPGGSITGAPKESAMRIIDQLEDNNRHIYTGSAGYISNNGDMYFNICIRTLLKIHDNYEYGVGGGIVWDSDVKDEWNEAHQKSKILELL
jgi:anthranilate/para-aminobenzoate synthase component I